MQDQNTKTTNTTNSPVADKAAGAVAQASAAATAAEKEAVPKPTAPASPKPAPAANAPRVAGKDASKARGLGLPSNDFVKRIADKVRASENILVALSRDPSVDELAAAIGLTLFLDGLQKHTTAIYSGQTPETLKFLQPEGTFEVNTDSLQDFIIALNKEKADHLRYKLDGDFVKVYITPYKTTITEEDLEFSYGDFNVDLVLALGVPTAEDLDGALSEHGRIMHDATTVDITCDAPGKFAEIEWSDPGVSSVCEMVTKLIFALKDNPDEPLDKEIATALLTGIVASTERFSNSRTTSDTMQLASRLMAMGADQQLIAAHVMDNNPGMMVAHDDSMETSAAPVDNSSLMVGQDYSGLTPNLTETAVPVDVPTTPLEQSLAMAQVAPNLGDASAASAGTENSDVSNAVNDAVNQVVANVAAAGATGVGIEPPAQPVIAPTPQVEEPKDYAKMLEQALNDPGLTASENAGLVPNINAVMPAGAGVVSVGDNTSAGADSSDGVAAETGAPVEAGTNGQAPVMPSTVMPSDGNPAASATPAEPVGEPVAHQAVILPPPPTPEVGADMMPPVLPNVQA